MLKDAVGRGARAAAHLGAKAIVGDADDLSGGNLAHVGGAGNVQRARLAGHDPAGAVVQLAQDQRADAVRVAEGVEGVLAHQDHGVTALEHAHRVRDARAQAVPALGEVADELGGHLGVGV